MSLGLLLVVLPLLFGASLMGGDGLSMERPTLSVGSASLPTEGRMRGKRPPSKPCSGLRRADGRRAAQPVWRLWPPVSSDGRAL